MCNLAAHAASASASLAKNEEEVYVLIRSAGQSNVLDLPRNRMYTCFASMYTNLSWDFEASIVPWVYV